MKKLILGFAMLFTMTRGVNAQYCTPTGALTCTAGDLATNVTFAGINNNSACSAGGYGDYSSSVAPGNVLLGATVPMSVTVGNGGTENVAVWIDYDHNNTFDATEYTFLGSGNNVVVSGNIVIPGTALTGPTRMRVRVRFSTVPTPTQACNLPGTFGEVEDYTVNINSPVPCAGTPAPGNTIATPATLCAGASTTLSVQNATTGQGVTYQWQSSSTGTAGSFTPILGATSNTYTVAPAASTYYQLAVTCSAGPATGTSTPIRVIVNPLPTVAVSPAVSCANTTNTLTATGADTYTWTPTAGLTPAAGNTPTVVANPTATTTYTVTGRITATGCQSTATAIVNSRPTSSVLSSPAAFVYQLNEGFDAAPAGWLITNNSNPVGTTNWFLNTSAVFNAFDGAATAAAGANFNNGSGVSNISSWLFTPQVNIKNGDVISFYTRTVDAPAFADRLQLRMSTNGASTNVGATDATVGDFTTLLVDVNPTLTTTGYPNTWTKYTVTISGVTGTVPGRFAFRYFVTNGGPAGANSDFIGLDRVQYGTPPAANCANNVNNLAVAITGGDGPYTVVYSDGTTNYTYNNYTSGNNINVAPAVTTTYSLVSVTSSAGCVGIGNSGTVTITVTPPTSITTQPAAITNACVGGNATITVTPSAATAASNSYQWQVSTDGGTTYTNVANGGVYSGATTATLTITGATAGMNNYMYRVNLIGYCGPAGGLLSTASTLSVNTPAVITAPAAAGTFTACTGSTTTTTNTTTLSVTATGNALTYQWQVSTNGGTTWTNLSNGANYAGVTTSTLSIINPPGTFLNNQYRVQVSSGGCAAVNSPAQTLIVVNTLPVVTISASPNGSLSPATPVVLTAAVSSATAPISYQWYLNNVLIPGATGATYTVNPNEPGDYSVTVRDANGCNAVTSTPFTLTVVPNPSTILFISPSPNNGVFNVRYFNSKATPTATEGAVLNVFDGKGSRVFTQRYVLTGPYTQMRVDLGVHSGGVYRVELSDNQGNRIQTGSVMVF